jgi:hypothetical protein
LEVRSEWTGFSIGVYNAVYMAAQNGNPGYVPVPDQRSLPF